MKYLTFIRHSESYRASPPPAALMEAMGRRLPGCRFFGLGGARMAELGFRPVVRADAR